MKKIVSLQAGHWPGYFLRACLWMLAFLLATEAFAFLALTGSFTIGKYQVDIWGMEGYGINFSVTKNEVWTPYNDGEVVMVMGDSFTLARQVMFDQSYVAVAESLLRAQGIKVDLRNASMGNTSLPSRLAAAQDAQKKYHPKVFVIQTSYDDFMEDGYSPKGWGYYFSFNDQGELSVKKQRPDRAAEKTSGGSPFFGSLFSWSAMWRISAAREGNNAAWQQPIAAPAPAASVRGGFTREQIFAKQAELIERSYKGAAILFLILSANIDQTQLPPRSIVSENDRWLIQQISTQTDWYVIYPSEQFDALMANGQTPFGFGNTEPFHGHLNANGHKAVGMLLAERLAEMLR